MLEVLVEHGHGCVGRRAQLVLVDRLVRVAAHLLGADLVRGLELILPLCAKGRLRRVRQ